MEFVKTDLETFFRSVKNTKKKIFIGLNFTLFN